MPPRSATPPQGATPPSGTGPGAPRQRTARTYGTAAHGTPAHGTLAYGVSGQGTPAHGTPAYGGRWEAAERGELGEFPRPHPENGEVPPRAPGGVGPGQGVPRPVAVPAPDSSQGPRQEYVDAFDDEIFFSQGRSSGARPDQAASEGPDSGNTPSPTETDDAERGTVRGGRRQRAGRNRTAGGVVAAAVATVLAVLVGGQLTDGANGGDPGAREAGVEREDEDVSRAGPREEPADARPTPSHDAKPPSYQAQLARAVPLDPDLRGSGRLAPVRGEDKGPGTGQVMRYRVDVEKGLPLDGEFFAEAVQRTLNDKRSWGHDGSRSFHRVSSGPVDFVVTLASPGTTADWCAKSGLDTTVDNVSCDSAATERVMINAWRWAQGSETYGDRIAAYRQMLINHEVGHRLGMGHLYCREDGALAPVMMQQTKTLTTENRTCRPNPWPHPRQS